MKKKQYDAAKADLHEIKRSDWKPITEPIARSISKTEPSCPLGHCTASARGEPSSCMLLMAGRRLPQQRSHDVEQPAR